jgi:hypothetical protein
MTGGGFTLPAPPPIRYSFAGFNWCIQVNLRDFNIIRYPDRGRISGGAEPRERD